MNGERRPAADATIAAAAERIGKTVVSGASGFVGSALAAALASAGEPVVGLGRTRIASACGVQRVQVDEAYSLDSISGIGLKDTQVFVHLAARTHSADLRDPNAAALYRAVNVELTLRLAKACMNAGVPRFILISSVKAGGERSHGRAMREADPPRPEDLYGRTKLEAEERLRELAAKSSMEVYVLRPPLVYGPGVKANFLRLLQLVHRGVPLPFGSVRNRRSMIGLQNLVDAVLCCARAPSDCAGTYFVSDGKDCSIAQVIEMIASSMRKRVRLINVPPRVLTALGSWTGRRDLVDRLVGDLQVDTGLIQSKLGWQPPCTVEDQVARTVDWYLGTHKS